MYRFALLTVGLLASFALLAPTAGADTTGSRTSRYSITTDPFTEPAGTVCPFELDVTFPFQKEYETDFYDSTGRLVQSNVTGPLFAVFTNAQTGASVERNLSGLGEFVYNPDGSITGTFDGHVGIGLHAGDTPSSRYLVTSGHTILTISASGQKTVQELDGSAEDICQTLAG
jgi:hypothetical protein